MKNWIKRWFDSEPPWGHFWNPMSGVLGGFLTVAVIGLAIIVIRAVTRV